MASVFTISNVFLFTLGLALAWEGISEIWDKWYTKQPLVSNVDFTDIRWPLVAISAGCIIIYCLIATQLTV